MTPIERVARALASVYFVEDDVDAIWHSFAHEAELVIQALREPSEEMVEAGDSECFEVSSLGVWQAMIDHALQER